MADTSPLADSGDDEVFAFSRFISLLGIVPGPRGTFDTDGPGDLCAHWTRWIESWFAPHLAPAFVEAYLNGAASKTGEVESIDSDLHGRLTETLRDRSIEAARTFLEGKTEMRGNREWIRFSERVEKGESPGHLTVVFALQSALYHLPLPSALLAYAWFEFQSRRGEGIPPEATEGEREIFSAILPHVSVAVAGKSGDSENESGKLRSI